MLGKASELKGSKLQARDGVIGKIKDLYFDDQAWTVRYLVADTGNWLTGRKVVLSPHAVKKIHAAEEHLMEVDLTQRQIEESPSIAEAVPITRQFEIEYYQYYNWPIYWNGPWAWGPMPYPGNLPPSGVIPVPSPDSAREKSGESHLRSVKDVTGYAIQALDDHFGHIDDFILDDQDWAIRYLVADTRNWLPGKKALLPAQWISSVSWEESRVYVDLDRDTVKRAPEYDPSKPPTRDFETRLFAYYDREPYWARTTGNAKAA
jgi:uncharacterized protein YrrD